MRGRSMKFLVLAAGAGLMALSGCASLGVGASHAASGYDVLVAHDGHGHDLTIVPQTGVAFRSGSPVTEEVKLEWTTEHDVDPGKMLVWNGSHTRLLAELDATAVDVHHHSGDPFQFSLAPRLNPHAPHALAAKVAPAMAPVVEDDTESLEDQADDIAYAPSEASLGQWNRAASLE